MKYLMFIALLSLFVSTGCRNTANPNDTGGSEINEPIRSAYDSGNEPSNTSNTAITDSTKIDSTEDR